MRICRNATYFPPNSDRHLIGNIPQSHQDCAQMGRHKWFKKDITENNRKGRIMTTATQDIIRKPSDFCCWRKKGYLQHEWLLPHCSPVLEKAEWDFQSVQIVQWRGVEFAALLWGCPWMAPLRQESHGSRVQLTGTTAPRCREHTQTGALGSGTLWNCNASIRETWNIPSPPVSKCGPIFAAGGAVLCGKCSSPWWGTQLTLLVLFHHHHQKAQAPHFPSPSACWDLIQHQPITTPATAGSNSLLSSADKHSLPHGPKKPSSPLGTRRPPLLSLCLDSF